MKRALRVAPALALVAVLAFAPAANGATVIRGVFRNGSYHWKPKITNVAKGTKVVWKSVTGTHTVTSYGGGWSKNTTISAGQHTSFTFNSTGTYKFYCTIHGSVSGGVCSGMCGKVVVG